MTGVPLNMSMLLKPTQWTLLTHPSAAAVELNPIWSTRQPVNRLI